jgi:hypothetical protein
VFLFFKRRLFRRPFPGATKAEARVTVSAVVIRNDGTREPIKVTNVEIRETPWQTS